MGRGLSTFTLETTFISCMFENMFQQLNDCHTNELLDHNLFLNWKLSANSRIVVKSTNSEIKLLVGLCIFSLQKYVIITPYSQLRYNFLV